MKKILNILLLFIVIPLNIVAQGSVILNSTTDGTTINAVQSGAGAGQFNCGSSFYDNGGSAGDYTNGDYSITFCASAGQYLSFNFTSISMGGGSAANTDYFSYNSGSGWVNINNTGGSNPSSYTFETSVGGCISFRIDPNGTGYGSGFAAMISCVTPPPNDNPCGAQPLSVFNSCNYTSVSNLGATNTTGVPNPTCGLYNGSDVWYTVTVPSTGIVNFSAETNGGITDGALALYTSSNGTCTGTFTQVGCNDDCAGFPFASSLMPCISTTAGQGLAGQTLFVRVFAYNGAQEGSFNVCATGSGCSTPTTADCLGAIPVCSNTSYTNLASGQGCVPDLNSTNDGCLAGEHNMTYYLIHIGTSGTWGFDATFPVSSNGIEYDWLLYSLPANPDITPSACNLTSPIRCSYASQAGKSEVGMGMVPDQAEFSENSSPSGDGYVHWLDAAVAGEYYLLGIDRWSTAGSAYTLSFTGTATMNCDIMYLPIELISFSGENVSDYNLLNWSTASENSNDYFIIERSEDGINWEVIAKPNGAGNSTSKIDYTYRDYDFNSKINYYKLSQVDYDGKNETFNIISINNSTKEIKNITIFDLTGKEIVEIRQPGTYFNVIEYIDGSFETKKIIK
jgi:hypothetical protein